jgi:tricorn protease
MYHETWRIERDFLYDPNTTASAFPRSRPATSRTSTARLALRVQLPLHRNAGRNHHRPHVHRRPVHARHAPKTGLLGADYTVENDRYRIAKISAAKTGPPALHRRSPCPASMSRRASICSPSTAAICTPPTTSTASSTAPPVSRPCSTSDPTPTAKTPAMSPSFPSVDEDGLRNLDWIESNRRKVDELSGGKVAYVYMPEHRRRRLHQLQPLLLLAQLDKQALVLDERWNEGGFIADYVSRRAQALPALRRHRARR